METQASTPMIHLKMISKIKNHQSASSKDFVDAVFHGMICCSPQVNSKSVSSDMKKESHFKQPHSQKYAATPLRLKDISKVRMARAVRGDDDTATTRSLLSDSSDFDDEDDENSICCSTTAGVNVAADYDFHQAMLTLTRNSSGLVGVFSLPEEIEVVRTKLVLPPALQAVQYTEPQLSQSMSTVSHHTSAAHAQ